MATTEINVARVQSSAMTHGASDYGLWRLVALFTEMYGLPLTLAMFPVLVWVYSRLSLQEERE